MNFKLGEKIKDWKKQAAYRLGTKAFEVAFSSTGGGQTFYGPNFRVFMPGATFDYEGQSGDLWANPAVMICVWWLARTFPEARLQVTEAGPFDTRKAIPNHPLTKLVRRPNTFYSQSYLWGCTIFSLLVDGNGYWYKGRDPAGRVKELWWIPHTLIRPIWPRKGEGDEFISGYAYNVNGEIKFFPVEDIVHFRHFVDPRNIRRGMSPFFPALREISTDNEASTFTAAIMRNFGSPGVMFSPKDGTITVTDKTREGLLDWWRSNHTGDNRGKPLIPTVPFNVEKLTLTPEELALDTIRTVPEDRISAIAGVPAMVAGLSSGAKQKTYANYREAREAALENTVVPFHQLTAEELEIQLLPDMGNPDTEEVSWNYRNVRAMQGDLDKVATRQVMMYKGGIATKNEARVAVGFDEVPDGDQFIPQVAGGPGGGVSGLSGQDLTSVMAKQPDELKRLLIEIEDPDKLELALKDLSSRVHAESIGPNGFH